MNGISFSSFTSASEAPQQNPRLVSAAHEFEACLMKEFLKPLQHDSLFAEEKEGDDSPSGSTETLMSYGAETLAKAISEHGGFGIAKKILDQFSKTANIVQLETKNSSIQS
jgi:Rod binding domain-containing protein